MNNERVVKVIKAIVAALAVAGVTVSPENQTAITSGFMAFYAVVSGIGAIFKK